VAHGAPVLLLDDERHLERVAQHHVDGVGARAQLRVLQQPPPVVVTQPDDDEPLRRDLDFRAAQQFGGVGH
jgi:hypothetical protein